MRQILPKFCGLQSNPTSDPKPSQGELNRLNHDYGRKGGIDFPTLKFSDIFLVSVCVYMVCVCVREKIEENPTQNRKLSDPIPLPDFFGLGSQTHILAEKIQFHICHTGWHDQMSRMITPRSTHGK